MRNNLRIAILVLGFLALMNSTAHAQFFAELLYRAKKGACPKSYADENNSYLPTFDNYQGCPNLGSAAFRLNLIKKGVGEFAEKAYLAGLAVGRISQLACTETQLTNLQLKPKDNDAFIKTFEDKIHLLGIEKRRMIELKKNMPYDRSALGEYEKSQARAAAIIETLPYTELAPIQTVINYAIQQYETYDTTRTDGWLSD